MWNCVRSFKCFCSMGGVLENPRLTSEMARAGGTLAVT